MPSKDPIRSAKKAVDAITGQPVRVNAETMLESPALRRQLREAKAALAAENRPRRTAGK